MSTDDNTEDLRARVNAALREFKEKNGHPALRRLLQTNAGTVAISEISDEDLPKVLAACGNASAQAAGSLRALAEEGGFDAMQPAAMARFNKRGR